MKPLSQNPSNSTPLSEQERQRNQGEKTDES